MFFVLPPDTNDGGESQEEKAISGLSSSAPQEEEATLESKSGGSSTALPDLPTSVEAKDENTGPNMFGSTGSAPTMEEKAPEKNSRDSSVFGCAYLTIALISALIGSIIGSLLMAVLIPYYMGLDPLALLSGKLSSATASSDIYPPKKIELKSGAEPAVAVAQKVMPSIVNIRVEKEVFDIFLQPVGKEKGVGSGIIIDEDGYILTVNHVVRDADNIYVTLPGDKDVSGKVVGRDPENDIAVVKVEKTGLPAADIGRSATLKVGETAIAIGSPYSLQHSVTSGIVSAIDRNISTVDPETGNRVSYSHLIQTDAAINPGNSGGALCNAKGEIVGVNVLIYSESGGSQGIGFAIPIDSAMRIASQIIHTGKASHPFIGVRGQTVKEELAKVHDLTVTYGAFVVEIVPASPAAQAGIKTGDVIIAVDNKKVKTWDDLIASVRNKKVGDKVTLTVIRDKEELKVDVILAEKPENIR